MTGLTHGRGHLCVAPLLRDFVSQQLQKDAAIAKERRKAREERALAAGGADSGPERPRKPKPKKGGGRGASAAGS
eukprot:476003-Pyramimonas_sp.AAC.1